MDLSWEVRACKKREEVLDLIPPQWRLSLPLPSPETQRDVTGVYVRQFLSEREIEITETDAVGIVEQTKTGKWTATEVVTAYCHRAALAHQLVSLKRRPLRLPIDVHFD
jgi:amidase